MMYSQSAYPTTPLGSCSVTIKQDGCFMVSFCNLGNQMGWFNFDPIALNNLFKHNGGFVSGCSLNCPGVANAFKLNYVKQTTVPDVMCIIETDAYTKLGFPQHFCLWRPDGKIVDPLNLNPDWHTNNYHIVSYRIFTPIKQPKVLHPIPEVIQPTPIVPIAPPIPQETPIIVETPQELPSDVIMQGTGTTLTEPIENPVADVPAANNDIPEPIIHDEEPIIPVDPNIQALNQAEQDLNGWNVWLVEFPILKSLINYLKSLWK